MGKKLRFFLRSSLPVDRILCGCFVVMLFLVLSECGGQHSGVSTTSSAPGAPTTPTPTAPTPQDPQGPQIQAPSNPASVTSPFTLTATIPTPFDYMNVIADGTVIYRTGYASVPEAEIFLPDGQHQLMLETYDTNNNPLYQNSINVNVAGQESPGLVSNIQNRTDWQWCTADMNGHTCASGLGNATSSITQDQATPSLSGSSARFDIGGKKGYSNALWWNSLGGGELLNQFTYSMDFYISNGNLPEALEFDLNQSVDGTRYTWGTECSFKNTHHWDVWNPQSGTWVTSSAPCPPLSSDTWHHLEWQFQRVNGQVNYISVTVDDNTMPVNLTFNPQTGWPYQDIDVAFQMDGNWSQTPYSVWIDNMTLAAGF